MKRHSQWCSAVLLMAAIAGTGMARVAAAQERVAASHQPADGTRGTEALLARPVTITLRGISVEQALDSVSRVADVPLQYWTDAVPSKTVLVNVSAHNEAFGSVCERILAGTDLRLVPTAAGHLMIVSATQPNLDSTANTGSISGRVIDSATGRALNGATLKILGTKLSVTSRDSGRFTIKGVPVGDQVVSVRLFGYRPAQRSIAVSENGSATMRIWLVSAPNVLSGVVTTATGTQERRTIGSDVTVINADSVMRIAPIQSVTDLLENRVPGLTIQHTSGMPGAPARLRLRGIGGGLVGGDNTNNDPIIIVDNVRRYSRQSTGRDRSLLGGNDPSNNPPSYMAPSSLDQIDPNSIETIEVFKGPSATSQWGSDAGNGVIVITTKHGRAGTTRVTASSNVGVQYMPGQYAPPNYFIFGGGSYTGGAASELCANAITTGATNLCQTAFRDSIVQFQQLNAPALSTFGTGTSNDESVTLSGGSSGLTYTLVGSAHNTLGYFKMPSFRREEYEGVYGSAPPSWMVRPDRYKDWSTTGTFGIGPTEGLQLTLGFSLLNSAQQQSSQQSVSVLASEYVDTAGIRRIWTDNTHGTEAPGLRGYALRVRLRSATSTNNIQADWTRWSWVTVQGVAGVSTVDRNDQSSTPFGIKGPLNGVSLGYFSAGHGESVTRTGTVGATLFPKGRITTTTGVQVTQASTNDNSAYQDTLQQGVEVPNNLKGAMQSSSASNTAGWFVEPKLNVGERFYAMPGFRLDGGSASTARGSKTGGILSLFPKLNFSWIAVDREGQAPLLGFLSLLRPRLAFGVAGVQPDPQWNLRLLVTKTTAVGYPPNLESLVCGLCVNTLGNSQLHPERSQETEGGFEAQLWGNRVSLNTSLYYKLRRDAIVNLPTAPSVFAMPFYLNLGRVRNTGLELQLQAGVIETPLVRWDVHSTFSTNRNALLSINQGALQYFTSGIGYRVGYPLDAVWVRPIAGYSDPDGDGRLRAGDVVLGDSPLYAGNGQPKYALPFGTDLSFWHGQISLNAEFDYTNGVTQANEAGLNQLRNAYWSPDAPLGVQAAAIAADRCSGAGDVFSPLPVCSYAGLVQTVSTLRFNSMSMNYVVPRSLGAKVGLPNLTLALKGSNLRLWSNYRGKDPNVNGNSIGEQILDAGQLPLPRTWRLSVNIGN